MEYKIIQQYKGFYWTSDNERKNAPGILTRYCDGRIELELIGSLDSDNNRYGEFTNNGRKGIHIIYGMDSDSKKITLFALSYGASLNLSCPFSIVKYRVLVFVYGKYIAGLDEPHEIEASVKFPELTMWCPPGLIKHSFIRGENGIDKITIETSDALIDTTICQHKMNDGTTIALKGDCYSESSTHNIKPILTQWTKLCVLQDKKNSIRNILKKIARFEKFLSFAAQKECQYSEIRLIDKATVQKTEDEFIHYLPIFLYMERLNGVNRYKSGDMKYLFYYSDVKEAFPTIISKWIDENDDMPLVIDHLVDSIIYRNGNNSADFMTAVQGVDGFWQRFREDSYRTNNNISPKKRISLDIELRELRNEFIDILCKTKEESKDNAIKDTRDFYSHLLKTGKKQMVLEGQELYNATCYLRDLLMCCVMKETGFKENTIKAIMKKRMCY